MRNTDQHICHLLLSRNKKGMDMLFEKYYESLVFWADSFLNDLDKSRDLVQDFFITIWEKETYKNWDHNRMKSYLFVAVKNLAYNRIKKKDVLKNTMEIALFDRVYEEYESQKDEVTRLVLEEIDKLPERSQQVLKCIYLKGMKYKEAAAELNVSVSTIKTLLLRSMKTIRLRSKHLEDLLLFYFFEKK